MTFLKFLLTKVFLKQLLIAILGLIVFSFLLLWWLRSTTNHNQRIEVPDLAKMSLNNVEDVLDDLDLAYQIQDSANYNPDFPKYSVIEQVPKAGNFVKENRKIYLYLNPSGYAKIKIPSVLGKTLRQAEPTLVATGFQIGKVSKRPHISDQVLELRYKGEKIDPGDELQKTSKIDLIIGDGSLNRIKTVDEDNSEETETDTQEDGQ